MDNVEKYIPYIINIILAIPGIIALLIKSRKDKADISSELVQDALNLKNDMKSDKEYSDKRFDSLSLELDTIRKSLLESQNQITTLKKNIKKLESRVSYLRKGIDVLVSQIEGLGEVPAWKPDLHREEEEE